MKILDIGEISGQTGIPPSALRFYEDLGLISSIGRRGMRRQYGQETLLQLSLIVMGKSAGFTLSEIAAMFGKNGEPNLPRDGLRKKADELDHQIRTLTSLRNVLRHVADCPAPSHLECPTFQRLVQLAGTRRTNSRKSKKVR